MKKIFLIIIILICGSKNFSQDCTGKELAELPGTWKQNPLVNPKDTRHPELLAIEKITCNKIIELIRSNFKAIPMGGDLFFSNPDGCLSASPATTIDYPIKDRFNTTPFLYGPSFDMLQFDCDHGKLGHIPGALLFMYITINQMPTPFQFTQSFFVSRIDINGNAIDKDPQNDRYGFAPVLPDAGKPYLDYTGDKIEGNGNYENHIVDQYRMIYKPGKLPFLPMSKKEYYEKWKNKYLQTMKVKDKVIEDKAAEAKRIAGGDKILEQLKKESHLSETFINKIDAILHSKSAEILAQPAIAGEELGEYYAQLMPNSDHAAYIVKVNPAYHNTSLPLNAPQVITIHYNYFFSKENSGAQYKYHGENVVKELERMNVFNLLTKTLQPMITQ